MTKKLSNQLYNIFTEEFYSKSQIESTWREGSSLHFCSEVLVVRPVVLVSSPGWMKRVERSGLLPREGVVMSMV